MKSWVIIGGGYRGILAAYLLAKAHCNVTLIERSESLGGVMNAQEWSGFYLDNGCHLFDNFSDEMTDIMFDLMDGNIIPVNVVYASVTEGVKKDGMAIPDYTFLERTAQQQILYEVVEAATTKPQNEATLEDLLSHRFGPTLAKHLATAGRKIFGVDASKLDSEAFLSTPFGRIRIVPDDMGLVLKESPALDERIAASSQDDPLKYYRHQATKYPYRNFYPRGKGMRTFCEKSLDCLQRLGVKVIFGETAANLSVNQAKLRITLTNGKEQEADRVLWTTDAGRLAEILFHENSLDSLEHKVPMVLYFFKCKEEQVGAYTYIHDYSEDTQIFRASTPGSYGQQIDAEGNSYVCFEVPATVRQELWADPDQYLNEIWREGENLGIVQGQLPVEHTVVRLPVSYKPPKVGYGHAREELLLRVRGFSDRITVAHQTAFSKVGILESLKALQES